jgi:PAB-dependent poly(A)-specific ribonuclease subunit 3
MTVVPRPSSSVLNQYHSLVPLEDLSVEEPSCALGLRSGVLKGVSSVDGMAYALRRIDHRQVIPSPELTAAAREAVARWTPLMGHPHIAALRGTFVSADMWEAPALYFAHDYHAGALSLETMHCGDGEGCTAASEPELWSYATQICCILRAVHGAGLAAGGGATLAPSKVLLCPTGVAVSGGGMNTGNRLRLAGVGIADVLRPEAVGIIGGQGIAAAQRNDLIAAGQLLAVLACGPTPVSLSDPVAAARHRCSQPLGRLIYGLATDGIADCAMFSQLLAPAAFDALEAERAATDRLKAELANELENGRLLRLLIKLAFVNERPDGDMDTEWAETGDRYILKLFRDFVFHQHNDEGAPVMDWGHVFESLNKLDVGVPEKVLLLSRDEMSMLVASYADIKRCAEGAYAELIQASKMAGTKARVERQQRDMVDRFHNHQ